MNIGRFAFHVPAIGQAQFCLPLCSGRAVYFANTRVAQRDSCRTGLAAKTARVGNVRSKCRVRVLRLTVYVAGEAAAAAIAYRIQFVRRLGLPKMTARTEFAQH